MKLVSNFLFLIILFFSSNLNSSANNRFKVALCVMATGKYLPYAQKMVESARKYFCTNQKVTYLIFTDDPKVFEDQNLLTQEELNSKDIKYFFQKRLGWPFDTMNRFHAYYGQKDLLEKFDYIFATDADMRFVDYVSDEILSERVGTQHPGFVGRRGTYETNPASRSYVRHNEGRIYFAGGFYGGNSKEFLKLIKTCIDNIDKDLESNFIAIWHDESHLNRYFIDNAPTKILSPSYCYPERWSLPYHKRLLALDKDHSQMRS